MCPATYAGTTSTPVTAVDVSHHRAARRFGHDTWENGSWEFTGNTGAWGPLSADEDLGYVYVPVETPTGDFCSGHQPGNNLFGESLVCLEARTGRRVCTSRWCTTAYGIGTRHISRPLDITVQRAPDQRLSRRSPSRAGVRVRPGERSAGVADRRTSGAADAMYPASGPRRRSPSFETRRLRQTGDHGRRPDRFHPALKAEAMKIAAQYRLGRIFHAAIGSGAGGRRGRSSCPRRPARQLARRSSRRKTGMLYVASVTFAAPVALAHDTRRTDMDYLGQYAHVHIGPGAAAGKAAMGTDYGDRSNTGEHAWMTPNGSTPDFVKYHPALKGSTSAKPAIRSTPILVTKSLLFTADGEGCTRCRRVRAVRCSARWRRAPASGARNEAAGQRHGDSDDVHAGRRAVPGDAGRRAGCAGRLIALTVR